MTPDYSARKRGLPTMPTSDRLKNMVKINPITECWNGKNVRYWLDVKLPNQDEL